MWSSSTRWAQQGAARKWLNTALKWYDKNEVHLAANCEDDTELDYAMRKKGQVDAIDTNQPRMRTTCERSRFHWSSSYLWGSKIHETFKGPIVVSSLRRSHL